MLGGGQTDIHRVDVHRLGGFLQGGEGLGRQGEQLNQLLGPLCVPVAHRHDPAAVGVT